MKKMFFLLISGLAIILLYFSCGNQTKTVQTTKGGEVTPKTEAVTIENEVEEIEAVEEIPIVIFVVASIRKTSCFGKCPVYEFKVYSNGIVEYNGKRHVERIGLHEGIAPEGMLEQIRAEGRKSGYMDLADYYPENGQRIPDLPSTFTSLNLGGIEKKINNNHNCPKALSAFEKYLVGLINQVEWKKVVKK